MKAKISLFLIFTLLIVCLSGCGKQKVLNYNIDSEIEKITSPELYPEELLNEQLQEELRDDATNEDTNLLDVDLIGYEAAPNKLPIDYMFSGNSDFYAQETIDWLGEKWTFNAYKSQYNADRTAVRLILGFNENDMDYAHRRIKEISDEFLKRYGNVIYQSNIYEYDLEDTLNNPVEIVAQVDEAYITYKIMMYELNNDRTIPAIQVFFINKEMTHDLSNTDLMVEINHLKNIAADEKIVLKTVVLHPNLGFIIDEPKDESERTPEENLISGGVFYN